MFLRWLPQPLGSLPVGAAVAQRILCGQDESVALALEELAQELFRLAFLVAVRRIDKIAARFGEGVKNPTAFAPDRNRWCPSSCQTWHNPSKAPKHASRCGQEFVFHRSVPGSLCSQIECGSSPLPLGEAASYRAVRVFLVCDVSLTQRESLTRSIPRDLSRGERWC